MNSRFVSLFLILVASALGQQTIETSLLSLVERFEWITTQCKKLLVTLPDGTVSTIDEIYGAIGHAKAEVAELPATSGNYLDSSKNQAILRKAGQANFNASKAISGAIMYRLEMIFAFEGDSPSSFELGLLADLLESLKKFVTDANDPFHRKLNSWSAGVTNLLRVELWETRRDLLLALEQPLQGLCGIKNQVNDVLGNNLRDSASEVLKSIRNAADWVKNNCKGLLFCLVDLIDMASKISTEANC